MTSEDLKVDPTNPAVHSHLAIMQQVIQRMSANSASSKAWCITLVSAILVLVAEKENANLFYLAYIPILLFFVLDAYYLALEKGFIGSYNGFVEKLHAGTLVPKDLYSVSPTGSQLLLILVSFFSFSIWPFYLVLGVLTHIASRVLT